MSIVAEMSSVGGASPRDHGGRMLSEKPPFAKLSAGDMTSMFTSMFAS